MSSIYVYKYVVEGYAIVDNDAEDTDKLSAFLDGIKREVAANDNELCIDVNGATLANNARNLKDVKEIFDARSAERVIEHRLRYKS